jgi:YD repeat-containing protein
MASVKLGADSLVSGVSYFPFGGPNLWTFGNADSYSRTFDKDGRIVGIAMPAGNNTALSYDAASRLTGTTENLLPNKGFGYDQLDRLTHDTSGTVAQTFTYDGTATTSNLTYAYPSNRNRLAGISGTSTETFTYDAAGNTLSHVTPTSYCFTYDDRGRMTQAAVEAVARTYGINGLGQRVVKADPLDPKTKVHFVYDEDGQYGRGH